MDSGNSGSMQSSSCGEEEFDSRADSISSFFNSSNLSPNQPHQQHHQPPLFDPLSTYLDVFSRPTHTPHHHPHQLSWPPHISHGGAAPPPAQPPSFLFNPSPSLPNIGTTTTTTITTTNTTPVVNTDQNVVRASTTSASASSHQDPGPNPALGSTRNPKKRSRASRRAPTTVLTTDTSNFRAMVQEFTGIPAPPFSSSASLPFPHRTRLDLFGGGGGSPSYLLRPFAHKLQPPPPQPPTFLSHHVHSSDNITSVTSSTTSAPLHVITSNASNSSSNSNYQLPSELGLLHKPQNLVLNMQSSGTTTATASTRHEDHHQHQQQQQQQQQQPITMLSFQSLLQSQPPSKPNSSSDHDLPLFGGLKMGSVMEELGGVSSTDAPRHHHHQMSHSYEDHHQQHHQMSHLRGFNGNFGGSSSSTTAVASTSQIVSSSGGSCKMNNNFSGAPSDCHADHHKGSESVPSRGEGMVDSWICPSD